jgi:DNA-binding response OmpR family regulator
MLLQEGLAVHGLRVDCAATIDEALAHLERTSYDALLCDLHLSAGGSVLDGREAATRLLEAAGGQKPAVIFMTGDLVESNGENSGRSEPRWLQKPFRVSDVLALLRDILSDVPAEARPAR